jgi:hypothetical protein
MGIMGNIWKKKEKLECLISSVLFNFGHVKTK